jgi:AraC-like DNA-binding protein/ligand-binding sensor protein
MELHALHKLLDDLSSSDLFKEYEQAFKEVTHLPLLLRDPDASKPVKHDQGVENPFCHFMREHNESCRTCMHVNGVHVPENSETQHHTCFAGIHVSAVPVKLHDKVIGYLQTGEVLLEAPTAEHLSASAKQVLDWGFKTDSDEIHALLQSSQVLTPKQYEAVVRLLEIFAKHISTLAEKLSVTADHMEPDGIKKSREFITSNLQHELNLDKVAHVANMSAAHFCRMFKRATGMNFSEYVNRLRIEKAKSLMSSTGLSISQVAYEVGFNSVTHFNRTFRKITGSTPTEFKQAV